MKKRIYTFTSDDEYPSRIDDVKVIANLLFEELRNIDYESSNPILINSKNLVINYLYSYIIHGNDCKHVFASENKGPNCKFYDPLLIDDHTFGITTNIDIITAEKIKAVLKNVLDMIEYMTGFRYTFKIDFVDYYAKDDDDESNRILAIDEIRRRKRVKIKEDISGKNRKKLLAPILSIVRG